MLNTEAAVKMLAGRWPDGTIILRGCSDDLTGEMSMFMHNKRLQYTVRVSEPNPRLACMIMEQFGGADGELAAAMRYFTQGLGKMISAVATCCSTSRLKNSVTLKWWDRSSPC
jgi:Manganese containing catalase